MFECNALESVFQQTAEMIIGCLLRYVWRFTIDNSRGEKGVKLQPTNIIFESSPTLNIWHLALIQLHTNGCHCYD